MPECSNGSETTDEWSKDASEFLTIFGRVPLLYSEFSLDAVDATVLPTRFGTTFQSITIGIRPESSRLNYELSHSTKNEVAGTISNLFERTRCSESE